MPERNRRSYSSKTVFTPDLEGEFNLENELKNVILAAFRSFAFLHSQGQKLKSWSSNGMSGPLPKADIRRPGGHVRFGADSDMGIFELPKRKSHPKATLRIQTS
jgi:hypothetical protein